MKPENIILGKAGEEQGKEGSQVTIIDGGAAERLARPDKAERPTSKSPKEKLEKLRLGNRDSISRGEAFKGTPLYAHHLVYNGEKEVSPETDLHSIILILLELRFKKEGIGSYKLQHSKTGQILF